MRADSIERGLLVAVLLGLSLGLVPFTGVFFAGIIAGLVVRRSQRGALVGLSAGVAHWFLVLFVVQRYPLLFLFLFPFSTYGTYGISLLWGMVFGLFTDLVSGALGGLVGGAIRPQPLRDSVPSKSEDTS